MYAPDRYNATELVKSLVAQRRSLQRQSRGFGWLVGASYLVFGLCCWDWMVKDWSFFRQVACFMLSLVAWPVAMAVFDALSVRFAGWPRCPVCGAKLAGLSPASRRCPACLAVIVAEPPLTCGYSLPEETALAPPPIRSNRSSIGNFIGTLIVMAVIFVPILGLLLPLGVALREATGIPVLNRWWPAGLGVLIILISGIFNGRFEQLLRVCTLIDAKCERLNRKLDKNYRSVIPDPAQLCPICGEEPEHRIVALTGNCSRCGAHILAVAVEPDSPEMMDWRRVGRYHRLTIVCWWYLGLVMIPGLYAVQILEKKLAGEWRLWGIAGALLVLIPLGWLVVVLPLARRKWGLNFKCPHCGQANGASQNAVIWGLFRRFGRCVKCRRKLIRDDFGNDCR